MAGGHGPWSLTSRRVSFTAYASISPAPSPILPGAPRAVHSKNPEIALTDRTGRDQVIRQDAVDQLRDTLAFPAARDKISPFLECRQRVGHGHAATAETQQWMIVLGVADCHYLLRA